MTPAERQLRDAIRPEDASRSRIEVEIARIGSKQKQLLTLRQLVALGLGRRAVSHRAQRHRLFRVHKGVYALHPPPYSPHQRYLGAAFACGPARTILDCAATVSIETLEELLMAADSGRPGLNRRRLEELVADHRGRRGTANLRELISDDPKETDSVSERRMLRLCRRSGIPEPATQFEVAVDGRSYRADFCWPGLRLIVECDSWRWHGGKLKTESDRDRDHLLTIAGWLVVHFTRNQIKLEPERTGNKLAALLDGRAAALGRDTSR